MVGVGLVVAAMGVVGGYAVLLGQSRHRARAAPLPLLTEAGFVLTSSDPDALVAGMDMIQLSDLVARRLLLGSVGAFGIWTLVALTISLRAAVQLAG